ncbi:MAG: FAD-dependent oxidoreductase, partial [Tumebacillaceae bacterium]
EFRWLVAPTRIIGEDGQVTGIELIRMELGEPDAKGRRKPVPIAGSEFTIETDCVIKAIGQKRHLQLLDAFGVAHHNGIPVLDAETFRTSLPTVYAAGDCIFGGGKTDAMVVDAAQQGKKTAYAIHASFAEKA